MSRGAKICLVVGAALVAVAAAATLALWRMARSVPAASTEPITAPAIRPLTKSGAGMTAKSPPRIGKAPLDLDKPRSAAAPAAEAAGAAPAAPTGDVGRARPSPAASGGVRDPAAVTFDPGKAPAPASPPAPPR